MWIFSSLAYGHNTVFPASCLYSCFAASIFYLQYMILNRAEFSVRDIAVLFGTDTCAGISSSWCSRGISTDTRTTEPGNLFIALRGERTDGHHYLAIAKERGASAAVVAADALALYTPFIGVLPLIIVPDTLVALGALASLHRSRFALPVIAVAGSAGKTTTKEMIASVLAQKYTVLKTEGNKNNRIGTPLTLLNLTEEHTAAVVEIGTNEPGEIAVLSKMVAPTHGIITNIGKEHLEKLIDLDGVEQEETELFAYLLANAGTTIVNLDDERLRAWYRPQNCVSYSTAVEADVCATVFLQEGVFPELQMISRGEHMPIALRTVGMVSAYNAVAATAVGVALGLPLAVARPALEAFEPTTAHGYARMAMMQVHGYTVLNDCYNANPASVHAALDTFAALQCKGKKVMVLGDMRELGESAAQEHTDVVRRVVMAEGVAILYLLGEEMHRAWHTSAMQHAVPTVQLCASTEQCSTLLRDVLQDGDALLVKGSRGMQLEKIIDALHS